MKVKLYFMGNWGFKSSIETLEVLDDYRKDKNFIKKIIEKLKDVNKNNNHWAEEGIGNYEWLYADIIPTNMALEDQINDFIEEINDKL